MHLGSINPNNWLPLLAFRKRLIAGEVAPESSTASVAPTSEASETTAARGIRKTACRPISAAKKQQILDLEPSGMHVGPTKCNQPSLEEATASGCLVCGNSLLVAQVKATPDWGSSQLEVSMVISLPGRASGEWMMLEAGVVAIVSLIWTSAILVSV